MSASSRSSSFEDLAVTSTPLDSARDGSIDVAVVAAGDEADNPIATAITTLQRARRAMHEELWTQLFIDDVFVDVTRALEVACEADEEVAFVATLRIPAIYFDAQPHRARVRFVCAVSRTVPRRAATTAETETSPAAEAEVDFVARRSLVLRRLGRT